VIKLSTRIVCFTFSNSGGQYGNTQEGFKIKKRFKVQKEFKPVTQTVEENER